MRVGVKVGIEVGIRGGVKAGIRARVGQRFKWCVAVVAPFHHERREHRRVRHGRGA